MARGTGSLMGVPVLAVYKNNFPLSFIIDVFPRKCHSISNAQSAVHQEQYQSPKAMSVRVSSATIVSRILAASSHDSSHLVIVERKRRRGAGLRSFQLRCRILRGPTSFPAEQKQSPAGFQFLPACDISVWPRPPKMTQCINCGCLVFDVCVAR
jgi:hypothetical protein